MTDAGPGFVPSSRVVGRLLFIFDPVGQLCGPLGGLWLCGLGRVHDLWAAGCACSRPWPQNRVVMSMQPQRWPGVPAETARVARSAFRRGALAIRARDELGAWYDDEAFAGAYGARGKPGISPAQLAMVTVLQFTENLTDRQTAD